MFYLLAALLMFACGGEPECTYNGKTFRVGETFPASDGCNTCKCEGSDIFVCTEKDCGKGKAKGKDAKAKDAKAKDSKGKDAKGKDAKGKKGKN